jgi:beta-N-acetylhexosaminidase
MDKLLLNRSIMKNAFWASLGCLLFLNQGFAQVGDSLDFKIGQMILIGMPGAEVDTAVLREVRTGKVGSLILFEKNISKTNSFAGLKQMTSTYQRSAPVPLFIGIDQEGGKVNRLKEKYGFPRSISAAAIGKSKSLDSARFYAASTAATLAGLGINVNFAPVVDLAIEPNNPAIVKPERSYSANEDTVVLFAKEVVKQHRHYGVITVLKHFPGHGSTKDDTHLGMADVTNTWKERELKPYKLLLASGYVDAVMTAHIVNKNLDKNGNPGTLSKPILDGILRKKLGYNGVVFSDDMQMHAIAKQYGLEDAIKMAVNAGVDIMCFSNNIQGTEERTVDKVHAIIKQFVANGAIPKERIEESYRRIMKLKSRLAEQEPVKKRKSN